jgi:hypothetical protein
VAEPWTNDLAALGEHTRRQLRPLSMPQETTKMRFFKAHPALAALAAVALLTALGGAAYAVVREVWVSIDADKPADQIEQDVHAQLEAAGVPASVHAEKSDDGKLKVSIQSADITAEQALHIAVNGKDAESTDRMVRLRVACDGKPDPGATLALAEVASGKDMVDVLENHDMSDDELAAAITKVFAAHGYKADVSVGPDGITATVHVPAT